MKSSSKAALITLAAAALVLAFRLLPRASAIDHMDFLVVGPGSLQFCDPLNPQFLAVAGKTSPASVTVAPITALVAGQRIDSALTLTTATGKSIGEGDLLQTDSAKLNLFVVDPRLGDFQTPAAEYQREARRWVFSFTPRNPGLYRIFADFTPAATGKELYVSTDIAVGPPAQPLPPSAAKSGEGGFVLRSSADPIYARQPVEFTLAPESNAKVHLAIFDSARSGMAFLHPDSGPFKVTLSDPGDYAAWAECIPPDGSQLSRLGPFRFSVRP